MVTVYFYEVIYHDVKKQMGSTKSDHSKQLIEWTLITLSSFHCAKPVVDHSIFKKTLQTIKEKLCFVTFKFFKVILGTFVSTKLQSSNLWIFQGFLKKPQNSIFSTYFKGVFMHSPLPLGSPLISSKYPLSN